MRHLKTYVRTYDNQFSAEVVVRPGFNQKFLGIIVNFGSADQQAIPGTAHFLEHKLFAKPEGPISQKFDQLGAGNNAFTTYNETMFFCWGTKHISQLADLLFEVVTKPYFTQDNVKQEIPIIRQELAMYQDRPDWQVNNALLTSMFADSLLATDIAGTFDSIGQITPEVLQTTYEQNYFAANMHFVAVGDFDQTSADELLTKVGHLSVGLPVREPASFGQAKLGNFGQVNLQLPIPPMFEVAFVLPDFKKIVKSNDFAQMLLETMLELKVGVLSDFYRQCQVEGLLTQPVDSSVEYTRQGNFIVISGNSSQPAEVVNRIKEIVGEPAMHLLDGEVAMKNFELAKKTQLADAIRGYNDLGNLALLFAEQAIEQEDFYDNIESFQRLNFHEFNRLCDQLLAGHQVAAVTTSEDK